MIIQDAQYVVAISKYLRKTKYQYINPNNLTAVVKF